MACTTLDNFDLNNMDLRCNCESALSSRPGARGVLPLLRFDNARYESAWCVV
jgi:hypothetical protein